MKTFEDLIGFIRKEVNKGIKNIPIPKNPKYLYDPIRYSLKGNGKRFRPILTHLVGRANKIDPDVIMNISLSVELLHNFTLIHDDIMDKDSVRHGQKTIHEKWDKSSAILAGDGVFALSQIILSSVNNNVMSAYFNKATLEICEGQALDKEFENNDKITESQYFEMIDKKTGALLSLSAILGPIYCEIDQEVISHYNDFGRNIGRGFQIHDDLLEITSNQDLMGKSLGSDLAEGKQTFMVIRARNLFPKKWKEIIIDSKSVDVVKNCKLFFDEKGIIETTRIKAESYFESARENLKQIKSIETGELLKFINLIEKRTF
tara:strand:- start:1190 stop:2143 length:954 start_codon:yes stop_codon:yes gene_type:complete